MIIDPDMTKRLTRAAIDDYEERKRRAQWEDADWAASQVATGTVRALAFLDAIEIARRDDEFAVELLAALKNIRRGKRGNISLPAHRLQLEKDFVSFYRLMWADERAGLVVKKGELSKEIYPERATDKAKVEADNRVRKAELAEIDKQIAFIDSLDAVVIVAEKLRGKSGKPLARSTLKTRKQKQ